MLEIMELLSILLRKGVNVYVVKGNYELKNDIQSKVLTFVFSLASEIKRELISQRTKEALAKRKAEGKKLGRPKGSFNSKLDEKREYIEELVSKEVSISSIAKILGVHYNTMKTYIESRKLAKKIKTIVPMEDFRNLKFKIKNGFIYLAKKQETLF